ncbi:hypothetical protein C8R45DRAFT_1103121 [Mycena sanguinolenta]|nr:hypothetical protein C8R45DRAFT_1103121 [Mycena sanguinolenta]
MDDDQPRITLTPVFRGYQWRSEAFVRGTWRMCDLKGHEGFITDLIRIDDNGVPPNDMHGSNPDFRAFLGLRNCLGIVVTNTSRYNSKAAGSFAITMLRFQVLDLLLSALPDGACLEKSPVADPPENDTTLKLMAALAQWPLYLRVLSRELGDGRQSIDVADSAPASQEYVVPLAAWSAMKSRALKTKTFKNLQAMGTALMWVLECRSDPLDTNFAKKASDVKLADVSSSLFEAIKDIEIGEVIRPLSYALNSSLCASFCNYDLAYNHGSIAPQIQMRAFIGRSRTPALVLMDHLITTVIRGVACGANVEDMVDLHWYAGATALSDNTGDEDCLLIDPSVARSSLPDFALREYIPVPALNIDRPLPVGSAGFGLAVSITGSVTSEEELEQRRLAKIKADDTRKAKEEQDRRAAEAAEEDKRRCELARLQREEKRRLAKEAKGGLGSEIARLAREAEERRIHEDQVRRAKEEAQARKEALQAAQASKLAEANKIR